MRKYLLLALLLLTPTSLFAQATNIAHGATLPVNCRAGDEFDKTSGGSEGQYRCSTPGAPGVWTIIGAGGSGNVTAAGTLTANQIVIGGGTTAVATLGSLGTTVTVLHGNAAGAPTFGAVAIGSDVSGLGANVATALGVAIGSAGAPVLFNGALGTPSSGSGASLDYPGKLVGLVAYAAGTDIALASTTSNTMADMDATNALVTFTAPASGNVLIHASVIHSVTAAAGDTYWGLRESTTTVAEAYMGSPNGGAPTMRRHLTFYVSGLTPGSSHTYKLAHRVTAANSVSAFTGPTYGRVVMEVWTAP